MKTSDATKSSPASSFSTKPFFAEPAPFFAKTAEEPSPFFIPTPIATTDSVQRSTQGGSLATQNTFGLAQLDSSIERSRKTDLAVEELGEDSSSTPDVQMQGGSPRTPPPVCNLSPAMFTVSNATPQSTGDVSATKNTTAGTVTLASPFVRFNADVQLTSSFCSDPTAVVDVGPVQTLNTSTRTGIYREGGRPGGRIVARHNNTMNNKRDAVWNDSTGVIRASFPEPWYSQPQRLSNLLRQSAVVRFVDRPEMVLPLRIGSGVLVETQGSDNFTVALSAKKDAQLLHLESNNWSVPWAMDLTATTVGLPVTIINSLLGPSVTTGDIAMVSGQEWVSFPTVADAFAADLRLLLDNLGPTLQNDIRSYFNIQKALVKKNIQADFVLAVNRTADWVGDDEVAVSAVGTAIKNIGVFDLGVGDSQAFTVALNDLFPTGFFPGAHINLFARDEEHTHGTIEWEFPYHAQLTPAHFSGEDGEYTITGVVR
ncbi:MAG: hypothetical protein AAFZ52_01305 [Bacteroidota bacterium]